MSFITRILLAVLLLPIAIPAADVYMVNGERKSFAIYRTNSAPVIDGRLDDDVWRDAAFVDDFHQTSPVNDAEPSEVSIVRVTYDDEYLYIAADLRDSNPNGILAKQMIQGKTLFFPEKRDFSCRMLAFSNLEILIRTVGRSSVPLIWRACVPM